nr:ORF55 [Bracoviriform inaniti]
MRTPQQQVINLFYENNKTNLWKQNVFSIHLNLFIHLNNRNREKAIGVVTVNTNYTFHLNLMKKIKQQNYLFGRLRLNTPFRNNNLREKVQRFSVPSVSLGLPRTRELNSPTPSTGTEGEISSEPFNVETLVGIYNRHIIGTCTKLSSSNGSVLGHDWMITSFEGKSSIHSRE